ncbi:MAG: hypothetical protein KGJ13_04245 [Patescibacteria group bacterium]|nr:hypothetical protein [Patescibacteria group bacterium]
METEFPDYVGFFTKEHVRSLIVGFFYLALALVFQGYASAYSVANSERFVGDLVLDHLPAIDLNAIIIEGAFLMILMALCVLLLQPRRLMFAVKAASVFIAVRSVCVAVTHLGLYPNQILPGNGFIDQVYVALNLQAGYFFSAHTGLPFLMALIFWDDKPWRYIFLCVSALFGISVLLAHVHYTIDVFAAPFMTYSIFKLSEYLFAQEYRWLNGEAKMITIGIKSASKAEARS